MTLCQLCDAPGDLNLCTPHITELVDMLTDLPRLAEHLAEAATGQTRLGEKARRSRSDEAPMRVNLRASMLSRDVDRMLFRWAVALRRRGVIYRAPVITAATTTARLCCWLADRATDIAGGDDAGDRHQELHAMIGKILRAINRPIPPRFCGPCPAPNRDDPARRCGHALMARREAAQVHCPQCDATHDVDQLLHALLTEVDHWRFTAPEILMIMETLGDPLPDRTFRHWRKTSVIRPTGWRRPDGRVSLRAGDQFEPMFRLSDVRRARDRHRHMVDGRKAAGQ